ncbi:MAG: hypothetical protein Q7T86_07935 [Hyphomicrobiaceae bacterium]|nr:hypothetical protein [Hyphomicrobiaceae bacterium]
MKKLICRFPTEFDRGNIDSRYGWYRLTHSNHQALIRIECGRTLTVISAC